MQTGKLIIGIDPGCSGGIAWIDTGKPRVEGLGCCKMPETPADVAGLFRGLLEEASYDDVVAFVEKVHSSPQMGVSSAFTFGHGAGVLAGALAALRISVVPVQPKRWKTVLGVPTAAGQGGFGKRDGEQKRVNKQFAASLFPWIKVTNALADALLICEYGCWLNGSRTEVPEVPAERPF